MARIRSIKPEFCTSEQVMEVSRDARLTLILMWPFCDDGGVHPASLKVLKAEIYPADDDVTTARIAEWLDELLQHGLIGRFAAGGQQYLHVTDWKTLQRIEKPQPLRYPQPNSEGAEKVIELFSGGKLPNRCGAQPGALPNHSGTATEALRPEGRKEGRESGGRGEEGKEPPCGPPTGDGSPSGEHIDQDLDKHPKPRRIKRVAGADRGTRVPDGDLPDEWGDAANRTRERHQLPLLSTNVLKLRWTSFHTYWAGVAGAKGLKRDWRATWLNDAISPHTEKKFPPEAKGLGGSAAAKPRPQAADWDLPTFFDAPTPAEAG